MHGGNISIAEIKESMPKSFVKLECFEETVIKMSQSITDDRGQKKFRLKEDKRLFEMYDPYFYIAEEHQSLQQASYSQFYADK